MQACNILCMEYLSDMVLSPQLSFRTDLWFLFLIYCQFQTRQVSHHHQKTAKKQQHLSNVETPSCLNTPLSTIIEYKS